MLEMVGSGSVPAVQRHPDSTGVGTRTQLRLAGRHPPVLRRLLPLRATPHRRGLWHSENYDWPVLQRRLRRPAHQD